VDDLPLGSHVVLNRLCDICNEPCIPTTYKTIIRNRKKHYGKDYCHKCAYAKREEIEANNVPFEKSIAGRFPDLLTDWHPTLNEITPDKVFAKGKTLCWWICPICKSEYDASASSRSSGRKCPYCHSLRVNHTNSLAKLRPDIAVEWHPIKNGNLTPDDVTYGSKKLVWWLCGKGHEWESKINGRTSRGDGCPRCSESKGEKKVSEILNKYKLFFLQQVKLLDCRNKQALIFDFVVLYKTKVFFIEYDGEQHFKPVRFRGISKEKAKTLFEKTKIRDKIKDEYCNKENVLLVRIPYFKFDQIEEIIHNLFLDLDTDIVTTKEIKLSNVI
jgi:hypothetical protein